MLIIADSGSTKTSWILHDQKGNKTPLTTIGLNPNYSSQQVIRETLEKYIKPHTSDKEDLVIKFYGSGCGGLKTISLVSGAFKEVFQDADILVASDLLGAARAMLREREGIACILGTGSNSGFYNGENISINVPPLGFILGDEGSGTYLGKAILADYLKGLMPTDISGKFDSFHKINKEEVIEKVYRGDFPAKYVAEFVKFISSTINEQYICSIVESAFRAFIERNLSLYPNFESKETCFTGSIAWCFKEQLQKVFDTDQFDMANEPDIAYPFLFNYVKGAEWRTQKKVIELVDSYFQNKPSGVPGNDDTGTMSAWLVYAMMGLYPIVPGEPTYTISTPMFDRVTIALDPKYYQNEQIVIERTGSLNEPIKEIKMDGKALNTYFISHKDLTNHHKLNVITK